MSGDLVLRGGAVMMTLGGENGHEEHIYYTHSNLGRVYHSLTDNTPTIRQYGYIGRSQRLLQLEEFYSLTCLSGAVG
jgi:hypothetical protein